MTTWPNAGIELWRELERNPGRFALIVGPDSDAVAYTLADLRGTVPLHVGQCLAELATRPNETMVRTRLRGHPVLTGLEVLFDPVLALEPVRFLAGLSRDNPPVVAVWPAPSSADQIGFPPGVAPNRNTAPELQGCLLLLTHPTLFADDAPFTAERFS